MHDTMTTVTKVSTRVATTTALTALFCAVTGLATMLAPTTAMAAAGWLQPFSEEQPAGQFCPDWNQRVTRTHCFGAYCDNIKLYCESLTEAQGGYDDWKIVGPTSEEYGPAACTFAHAGDFGAITGMKCTGRYCDNISIECGHPEPGHSLSACSYSFWVSEEGDGINYFSGSEHFAKGARAVQCSGDYCDSMRYLVCVET